MGTSPPSVAVIVPTFNRADLLEQCLDSLLAQTLAPAQVLVVDDGSVDATAAVLGATQAKVESISTPQLGKAGAVNVGLAHVRADYVWIFDDDDVALPDALERFVAPLEASPDVGFAFSTMYFTPSDPATGRLGAPERVSWVPPDAETDFLLALLRTCFLGGATLFARSSVYDEVGPFDETLIRSQDYEMAIRIARRFRGQRIHGEPTFHYRQHAGERGPRRVRFPAAERERKWFEYDQAMFRRLREELCLEELIPSDHTKGTAARAALIHRAAIMASRLLVDETIADLADAAAACDGSPLAQSEQLALRRMLRTNANHAERRIMDDARAAAAVDAIATGPSALAATLKQELREARVTRTYRRYVPRTARTWLSRVTRRHR